MTEPAIEAKSVRKRFGKVQALDGLDLVAGRGEVTAILGPNGAGKTTFMRSVATLVKPDSGALRVAGVDAVADPAQVRRLIGLAGQYALGWSVGLVLTFAPLAVLRYRRA